VPIKKEKQPLSVTHPELAKEADGWDPSKVLYTDSDFRNWIGKCEHKWNARIDSRVKNKSSCPICKNMLVQKGFNDLATLFPDIAAEADGWDPSEVVGGGQIVRSWKCKLGHKWEVKVSHRTHSGSNCPVCANKKILKGFNDLATLFPDIAAEADGWDPSEVFSGLDRSLSWKCKLNHSWKASPDSRTGRGNGCPICGNKKLLRGFNDLQTTHPQIAAEANGWDPSLFFAGSGKKMDWKCPLGHTYSAVLSSRALGTNCPICANRVVLPGFNDLETRFPEVAAEAYGWDPSREIFGSTKMRRFKCAKGHIWMVRIAHRTTDGSNCPGCSSTGFNPSKDGYLYFLRSDPWGMLQIGITNVPDDRLADHRRLGWELVEIRGPMDGYLTQQWETAILRMLKAKGADLSNEKIAGKFDGYSEAWSKSTFEVKTIKELMRLTEEFEDKNNKN